MLLGQLVQFGGGRWVASGGDDVRDLARAECTQLLDELEADASVGSCGGSWNRNDELD